jgi:hypothetical protein
MSVIQAGLSFHALIGMHYHDGGEYEAPFNPKTPA